MLEPAVEPLYRARQDAAVSRNDIRLALASFHQWVALDGVFGREFRRSAGLRSKSAALQQKQWWVKTLRQQMTLPDT